MLRDAWQVETHDRDDPARPVILRTTLLPIGDVMLAIDRGWWRRASQHDRQVLLSEHRAAIAIHLSLLGRVAKLGALVGAAAGVALAWVAQWPMPAVVPAALVAGWVFARNAIAGRLKTGLSGILKS